MNTDREHELAVAKFFSQCESDAPSLYAEVCERHPVLTARQMTSRARREIPISQLEHKDLRNRVEDMFYANVADFDMTSDGSA